MMKQIQNNGDTDGSRTRELIKDLEVHMNGEEKYLYPSLEAFEELHELIIEAYEEHEAAKMVLIKLRWMTSDDVGFKARLKVLKDLVEHHIDEEENNIFPEAKKVVSDEQMAEIKDEYVSYHHKKMNGLFSRI